MSKRYQKASEAVDLKKDYPLREAVGALFKMPKVKFDETVEISAHLAVDPKQSDQMVRGMLKLPHGSGKQVRVLVFTENAQEALDAGADFAGFQDMIEKVLGGWTDFDVAIATTSAMKEVRKVARVLGPRGLMPSPKSGTVTDNVAEGIKDVKSGRVEFKMDKSANVAVVVGKRSFSEEHLAENAAAAVDALGKARPESLKGSYIKSVTLSSTMSPGVRVDSAEFAKL